MPQPPPLPPPGITAFLDDLRPGAKLAAAGLPATRDHSRAHVIAQTMEPTAP